jgi:ribonucleotide monophosphatase NagD (HAD superfamily)
VIRNMAQKYGFTTQSKSFVVFDLDGTLADITTRKKAAIRPDGSLNYRIFFDPMLVDSDTPIQANIDRIQNHRDIGHEIVILTGRSDRTKEATIAWFKKHGVTYDRLIMRPESNHQDDAVWKRGVMNTYLDKTKCVLVYEDRPKVIREWRAMGIAVVDCGDGTEF